MGRGDYRGEGVSKKKQSTIGITLPEFFYRRGKKIENVQ